MNRPLLLLTLAQSLFLVNNITFIFINGLVGLELAPYGWMATLPIMGYVVGGAMAAPLVARAQARWGRKVSFQMGLAVAFVSALLAALAVWLRLFPLLVLATMIAGYYNANGQLYRFAAAELARPDWREKAMSLVLAGGLLGGVVGPSLAGWARGLLPTPFVGAYLVLAVVAVLALGVIALIDFTPPAPSSDANTSAEASAQAAVEAARPLAQIMRQPAFVVATLGAAMSYGVMNLMMAATPLAMQVCGFQLTDTAYVMQWHIVGMYAPGLFTGHFIKRLGVLPVMAAGVVLNLVCVGVALSGVEFQHFLWALLLQGVGWNFLFTGSTALALRTYHPVERDRAQAAINFCVFATMAFTSFASGALVTTQGWTWLNFGSLPPLLLVGVALAWLGTRARAA
jgi:MFS family permease